MGEYLVTEDPKATPATTPNGFLRILIVCIPQSDIRPCETNTGIRMCPSCHSVLGVDDRLPWVREDLQGDNHILALYDDIIEGEPKFLHSLTYLEIPSVDFEARAEGRINRPPRTMLFQSHYRSLLPYLPILR